MEITPYTALIDGEAGAYGIYFPDPPGEPPWSNVGRGDGKRR